MILTTKNFTLFAACNYVNPSCVDIAEFSEDVARFRYLKLAIKKYQETTVLQERLILNHIIIISNVFERRAAVKMMFFSNPVEHWPALKTFLLYLNLITTEEYPNVQTDLTVTHKLQRL